MNYQKQLSSCWECGEAAPSGVCLGPHPEWALPDYQARLSGSSRGMRRGIGLFHVERSTEPIQYATGPMTHRRRRRHEDVVADGLPKR